jgi:hypothetical protein
MVRSQSMKLQNLREIVNYMELCEVDNSWRNHEFVCN